MDVYSWRPDGDAPAGTPVDAVLDAVADAPPDVAAPGTVEHDSEPSVTPTHADATTNAGADATLDEMGTDLTGAATSEADAASTSEASEASAEPASSSRTAAATMIDAPLDAATAALTPESGVEAAETVATTETVQAEGDRIGAATGERDLLRTGLAEAMHAALRSQRERLADDLEHRRTAHLVDVQARAAAEEAELSRQADLDLATAEDWARTESARIEAERVRRLDARRQELDAQLEWHRRIVELEIAGVEEHLAAHRTKVDDFFANLEGDSDPSSIAALADRLPATPRLDEVGAEARARAIAAKPAPAPIVVAAPTEAASVDLDHEAEVSEARLVAVMAPMPTEPDPAAWSVTEQTQPVVALADAMPDRPGSFLRDASSMPAVEARVHRLPTEGGLLAKMPAARPFSWLSRSDGHRDS